MGHRVPWGGTRACRRRQRFRTQRWEHRGAQRRGTAFATYAAEGPHRPGDGRRDAEVDVQGQHGRTQEAEIAQAQAACRATRDHERDVHPRRSTSILLHRCLLGRRIVAHHDQYIVTGLADCSPRKRWNVRSSFFPGRRRQQAIQVRGSRFGSQSVTESVVVIVHKLRPFALLRPKILGGAVEVTGEPRVPRCMRVSQPTRVLGNPVSDLRFCRTDIPRTVEHGKRSVRETGSRVRCSGNSRLGTERSIT